MRVVGSDKDVEGTVEFELINSSENDECNQLSTLSKTKAKDHFIAGCLLNVTDVCLM